MLDRLTSFSEKIIPYSFYLLFFLTPLFWTSLNYELFEFNKMLLTYGLTIIIVGAWILKMIDQKKLIFKTTPLDLALLLFLLANILSTIFSQDRHVSIWGYYSRSNGGLLSIISYLLLYWAFVSNMDFGKVLKTLKVALASGVIVSIWGILEHFGVSPSCVILRNEFNADCWIQDVQARVFATLGQPNWMAGYLSMLIFISIYFYLTASSIIHKINYYTLTLILYLAFTFTYSRGPTLGLLAGVIAFVILIFPTLLKSFTNLKLLSLVIGSCLLINLLFGSALTSFRLVSQFAAPVRPAIALPPTTVTQLENGGTESGQIRFIVWQGAINIFKSYPLFGTGLETFAYSYYQFRPQEHNLTSEWDFLYNKAHNEYLNYLSTTGIVGFSTYMLIIALFILRSILLLATKLTKEQKILVAAFIGSYVSYLVYNFFLFSVVILAIFFYLFPALTFVVTDSTKTFIWPKFLPNIGFLSSLIYRRPAYTKASKVIIIFITLYLIYSIFKLWYADTLFNKGQSASDSGNPGKAYNLLTAAVSLNRFEPFYKSELSYNAAQAAVALKETDATLSAALKDEAEENINHVLSTSPKNVSYLRTAVRTYFELSYIDDSYTEKTLEVLDQAIALAPTDPKLYFNKALILDSIDEQSSRWRTKKEESIKALQNALDLKPNYLEVKDLLEEATKSADQ